MSGPKVTLLGTGLMGSGMARSLARAGLAVTAWNRTAGKARPLADAGVRVAGDVAEAVSDADVVVTMLFDAAAAEEVLSPILPGLGEGTVWVQSGTVGLDGTRRLAELAGRHGVTFVDAPVLGTRGPAEKGQLVVLASGPRDVRDAVTPVFDAIGRKTLWVSEHPGDGHRLKLAANAWLLSVTAATAQSVALAGDLGLDPHLFLEAIKGGPLDCDYAQTKGQAMIARAFEPQFGLAGAVKDSVLIATAMKDTGTADTLMRAAHDRFAAAANAGYGESDMSAVVLSFGS